MPCLNFHTLRTVFSQRFLERLEQSTLPNVSQETSKVSTQSLTDSVELSLQDFSKAISQGVLNASRVSGLAAGAALALTIASQVGQQLDLEPSREQLRGEIRDSWISVETQPKLSSSWSEILSKSSLDDAQLVCVEQGGNSPMALMGDVYFPKDAAQQFSKQAERDFVLGHEVGHLENGDSKTQFGFNLLLQSLDESPDSNTLEFGNLRRELDIQIGAENHRQEYRADQRGLEIAVSLGHDPSSAIAFLAGLPSSSSHPSGNDRLKALVARPQALSSREFAPSIPS